MERISYQELPQDLFSGMLKTEEKLRDSGISTKELELMRYRASQINNCAYCLDMHFKEATHAGESPLRLYSVSAWREAPYYSEREQAMLAMAEALTLLPEEGIHEALYEELQKHFSKAEIANLALAVAQINSWNRLVNCFKFTPGNYEVGQH
ncbi:carboxymuconolactone decarboxylase family protein [Fulvivirga sp. 29W222]|uniref:Carboxymuconolactone decarboxylase family protein n=1 Tax=Fulvivirga marina TaxID=2494733 RepID=A0A937FXM8_9BACT|nr:carboxymuconolactone decarboxylase family protein [Fulvivirga marina]MBL6448014.1 carboxymuconolactone decarboxylase family protein [Fulvivirga marina]